jgi:glycosyltransferase involved in cell wall biosynthesis
MKKLTPRTLALALEYHLFKKDGALLSRLVPAKMQGMLRRRARAKYLIWDARSYAEWMKPHLEDRRRLYTGSLTPGLLSIATPVWDGTPLAFLKLLAESIAVQNQAGACEWLLLDNGCTKTEVLAYLQELAKWKWVNLIRNEKNEGIVGGLRRCLEHASGRYLLPVDSDDWLYPDCLQIVQDWITKSGYPALLYSDEDKVIGPHAVQPYFKPDFDPVLLLNSAYIAHLGVIDRKEALEVGAYSDRKAEGSPDWDCFVRFYCAGHEAVHIPEVIYSWRMHPESTADDAGSKPYIHDSQRTVLQRFLDARGLNDRQQIVYSPLLPGSCDWWYQRKPVAPQPTTLVKLTAELTDIGLWRGAPVSALVARSGSDDHLVCLLSETVQVEREDWLWDAMALFERHQDAVMIGGRIANSEGVVTDGGQVLGFGSGCECPDKGRPIVDPGYFTQMRKQRSVSAVSSQFAVIRSSFLRSCFESGELQAASLGFLGAWLGVAALRAKRRVIYSPLLSGRSDFDWDSLVAVEERSCFLEASKNFYPDCRFYPRPFGLTAGTAYKLPRLRQ